MSGSAFPAPHPEDLVVLERARELAMRGRGRVSPNPLVGAVVVGGDGAILGQGWHEGPGTAHAEVMALRGAGERARGATVVCTLEPCSHHGRTPPCTDALRAAGVARVVVGSLDPLEQGRAQGARVLADAGMEVVVARGEAEAACRELNGAFLTWALTGRPEVLLKMASSLDGKVATASGETRWITGPAARSLVHRWRADADAVAVGIGTALADDPDLSAREVEGPVRQPLRVVLDSGARLPTSGRLASSARERPVLVVCASGADAMRVAALRRAGVDVVELPGDPGERLERALAELGAREVQSLLVEGGPGLAAAMLSAGAVDRVAWFLAPILIGGVRAPGAVAGAGVQGLAEAPRISDPHMEAVGGDVLVSGRLRPLAGGGPS